MSLKQFLYKTRTTNIETTGATFGKSALKGAVGDINTFEFDIVVDYNARASSISEFNITGNVGNNIIYRDSGSFVSDGFELGDTIDYYSSINSTVTASSRTITGVSDLLMTFDGAAVSDSYSNQSAGVNCVTDFVDLDVYVNVCPSNAISNISLVDNLIPYYRVDIDTGGGVQSTSYISGDYQANYPTAKDDIESVKVKFVNTTTTNNSYTQTFRVEAVLRIKPVYLDGDLTSFQNISTPYYFDNTNLTEVIKVYPRTNAANENRAVDNSSFNSSGATCWYNDSNGSTSGSPLYELDSISYTDQLTSLSVTGLQVDRVTQVNVILEGANWNQGNVDFDSLYDVLIYKLPSVAEYTLNNNSLNTNFVLDNLTAARNAASSDSSFIKNLLITAGSPATDKVNIAFDVDFSASQQLLLSSDNYYALSVCGSFNPKGDIVSRVLCDVNQYLIDNDTAGLITYQSHEFLTHPDIIGGGYSDVKRPNEAKFLSSATFSIDLSLNAVINKVKQSLVAYDLVEGKSFIIEENVFNTQSAIVSGGVQQINIDQTKGYKLAEGSLFNYKKITTGAKIGNDQYYQLDIAHTFNWMDYLALPDADTEFYDNNLLNDGLNQKIKRYSGSNGFEVAVFWEFEMSDGSSVTDYRFVSPNLDVFDYEESIEAYSSTEIQVFLSDGVTEITGAITKDETMVIKATFTPDVAFDPTDNYYGIFRVEKYQDGGLNAINERSSINASADFNPLLPPVGQSFLTVTNNGSNVIVEGRLDPTRLTDVTQGETIHLTAEIGLGKPDGKITESGDMKITEGSDLKIVE